MPDARYRLYFDDSPADADALAQLAGVRVEQAIGMAAAAELEVSLATDDAGVWSGFEESFAQPFTRVRVEVKVGEGDYIALIDGPVVGHRFDLDATPDASRLVVVAHDDSVLLDRDESVVVFENVPPSQIIDQLISGANLTPRVSAQLADPGAAFDRYVVQRGTPMSTLRILARRFGMFVYVEPGDTPGQSVAVFEAPTANDERLPELVLLGPDRNIGRFSAEFDALRPLAPKASNVKAVDKQTVTGQANSDDGTPLGDDAAHSLVSAPVTLLSHTREEQSDVDTATAGVARLSAWAYRARGEVDNDLYDGVLRPHRKVRVRGAGRSSPATT
jgi:hypothetical protein